MANIYCVHDESTCRSQDWAWPSDYAWPLWPGKPEWRGPEWKGAKRAYRDLWRYEQARALPCYILNGSTFYAPDPSVPATCLENEDPLNNQPATPDNLSYYPGLYYRVLSVFTGNTIRESVVAWRVVNVLIATAIMSGAVLLSARRYRRPVVVSTLVAAMPLGMFLVPSVNPTSWLVIGTAAFLGPALSLLREHGPPQLLVARVGFLLLCLLMIVAGRSEGIAHAVVLVAAALLLGLKASRVAYGLVFAIGLGAAATVAVLISSDAAKAQLNLDFLSSSIGSAGKWDALVFHPVFFFGGDAYRLSWLEILPPPAAVVAALAAFWGAAALGLFVVFWRKALALALVGGALLVVPAALTLGGRTSPPTRYFLPLVFMLAFVFLVPKASGWLPRWSRAQWIFLGAALSIANSLSLLYLTVRYVSGINPGTTNPRTLAATPTPDWWWGAWLSPFANWLLGSIAFAAFVGVLFSLPSIREGAEDHPPEEHPEQPDDPYHDFWNSPDGKSDPVGAS